MIFSNSVTACGAAAGDRSEGGSSSDGGGEVGSLHRKASKLKLNHGGGVGGGLNRYFPAATSDPDIAGLVSLTHFHYVMSFWNQGLKKYGVWWLIFHSGKSMNFFRQRNHQWVSGQTWDILDDNAPLVPPVTTKTIVATMSGQGCVTNNVVPAVHQSGGTTEKAGSSSAGSVRRATSIRRGSRGILLRGHSRYVLLML